MPASRRPRHKRQQKTTGRQLLLTQPWKIKMVFAPLESILDQLERDGTVTVVHEGDQKGMPVFKIDGDREWYATGPALRGLTQAFYAHGVRTGKALPVNEIDRFADMLEAGKKVRAQDIQQVRSAMAVLKKEAQYFTVDYAQDLIKTVQVSEQLEKLGIA